MDKVITSTDSKKLASLFHKQAITVVLAGGCFDCLHPGHIAFLKHAKKQGDKLIILLESDEMIKKRKGSSRPFESQMKRAEVLSHQPSVDYVILLPSIMTHADYDELVSQLKPAIIATTKGDPSRHHKERQAQHIGAQVIDVINRLPNFATSNLIKKYENE